jgi:aminoglycoside 6'-N-acetyltransferase I
MRSRRTPIDVAVRHLGHRDLKVLETVAPDLFDGAISRASAAAFLRDPHHHLVVAIAGGQVVGFASGVQCMHPDKAPDLFLDAVGVARGHRGHGIGRTLVDHLLSHARAIGCERAWAAVEGRDTAVSRLYAASGGTRLAGHFSMVVFRLGPGGRGAS